MGIMKGTAGGGGGGEIVQVEGGHIVRSTGRKDRHSKVYTSKGPRDRRVRLSAHTAIQFYDVQDRLGFDRPSKAVDWLIKKAKSSIDKLADLPPWQPTSASLPVADPATAAPPPDSSPGEMPHPELPGGYAAAAGSASSSFMPPPQPLDDSDTMKLFFPTSNSGPSSSSISFTGYSVPPEMVVARAAAAHRNADLGLSLHSFPDNSGSIQSSGSRALFMGAAASAPDAYDHYPRMMGWAGSGAGAGEPNTEETRGGPSHGFFMNHGVGSASASALMMVNPHQRGPLQSNFTGGFDELPIAMPSESHHHHHHHHHNHKPPLAAAVHQPSFLGTRFGSDSLTGFYFPTRIIGGSGNEEHNGIVSGRPSSSDSPNSGHH